MVTTEFRLQYKNQYSRHRWKVSTKRKCSSRLNSWRNMQQIPTQTMDSCLHRWLSWASYKKRRVWSLYSVTKQTSYTLLILWCQELKFQCRAPSPSACSWLPYWRRGLLQQSGVPVWLTISFTVTSVYTSRKAHQTTERVFWKLGIHLHSYTTVDSSPLWYKGKRKCWQTCKIGWKAGATWNQHDL